MMRDPDGVGEGEHEECMDLVRFHLRVQEGRVREARFQAYGCGPTIAAASAATEVAAGALLVELLEMEAARIEAAVGGLPEPRRHAAEVAVRGLRAAARDALSRASTRSERHA
jgi:NifU-like protein involved in Fe-S cluster formation